MHSNGPLRPTREAKYYRAQNIDIELCLMHEILSPNIDREYGPSDKTGSGQNVITKRFICLISIQNTIDATCPAWR